MKGTIRKYKPTDFEALQDVCHLTATAPQYVKDKALVDTLYLDYYAIEEPEHIFVCADENDETVGYVICAVDYAKFRDVFMKKYASKIKKQYPLDYIAKWAEPLWMKKISKDYPAHLHIDLLPDYQHGGNGGKLIEMLLAHLKSLGVKGISLGCGADNENAHGFYEHLGFELRKKVFGMEYIYVKKL